MFTNAHKLLCIRIYKLCLKCIPISKSAIRNISFIEKESLDKKYIISDVDGLLHPWLFDENPKTHKISTSIDNVTF